MKRTSSPNHEQAVLRLACKRGPLHTRDIAALGVPTVVLTRLVRAGKLERAGRGVYALAEVAPRGVMCLLSALRVHDIGTQAPFEVWLALPAGAAASAAWLAGDSYSAVVQWLADAGHRAHRSRWRQGAGVQRHQDDCRLLQVPQQDRPDVALGALREGWRERKVNMDALWHCAS